MGIFYTEKKTNMVHVCGRITRIFENKTSSGAPSLAVNITHTDKMGKTYLCITLLNMKNLNLCDWGKKALKPGMLAYFTVFPMNEGTPAKDGTRRLFSNAVSFERNGYREIRDDDESHAVLIGRVFNLTPMKNGGYRGSIPVHRGAEEARTTTWYSVFLHDERDIELIKDGKVKNGDYVCLFAKPAQEHKHDDKEYLNVEGSIAGFLSSAKKE